MTFGILNHNRNTHLLHLVLFLHFLIYVLFALAVRTDLSVAVFSRDLQDALAQAVCLQNSRVVTDRVELRLVEVAQYLQLDESGRSLGRRTSVLRNHSQLQHTAPPAGQQLY